MNAKRYRLQGIRYTTGEVSLQNRPNCHVANQKDTIVDDMSDERETVENVAGAA